MIVIDESVAATVEAPVTEAELERLEASCVCRCADPRCNARVGLMVIRELRLRRAQSGERS